RDPPLPRSSSIEVAAAHQGSTGRASYCRSRPTPAHLGHNEAHVLRTWSHRDEAARQAVLLVRERNGQGHEVRAAHAIFLADGPNLGRSVREGLDVGPVARPLGT